MKAFALGFITTTLIILLIEHHTIGLVMASGLSIYLTIDELFKKK